MRGIYACLLAFFTTICLLIPEWVMAAGGGKVDMLVVVADNRVVSWGPTLFFLDVYNTNPTMFGVWCVILTAVIGCSLGLTADFLMSRTGLDLTSRKIIEH
jgi:uncharacterized membrane protein YdjX (TVP38/TMEM64 family)